MSVALSVFINIFVGESSVNFQVLPPKFLANDLISNVSRLDAGDASSLKEKVLDFIVSLQTHPPASWPSLQPLK